MQKKEKKASMQGNSAMVTGILLFIKKNKKFIRTVFVLFYSIHREIKLPGLVK